MGARNNKMTEKDIKIEYVRRGIQKEPMLLLENSMLQITSKESEKIPFTLNPIQKKLHDVIIENYGRRPLRLIVLKARKEGISTYISALFYALTSQTENTDCVVTAHESDASSYIFNIYKFYHENMGEFQFLAPELKKNNAKMLEFDKKNSAIYVKVASGEGVGRSFTPRLVHCSEVAFYSNADEVFLGLNNSIPKSANTIVVLESTANGVGNYFHRTWKKAVDYSEWNGEGYIRIFFSWFDSDDNVLPLKKGHVLSYPLLYQNELRQMRETYPFLTDEQMNWYIRTLNDDCGNDLNKMRQEHPSNPQEAFISTGTPIFNQKLLEQIWETENNLKEAHVWKKYNIVEEYGNWKLALGDENGKFGLIDIYQMPQTQFNYIISCDIAEGVEGGDFSVANVFNITTGEQCAHFRFDQDVDAFAKNVSHLGKIYQNALISPERNNHGHAFISYLKNVEKYNNIYMHQDEKDNNRKEGFPTNIVTRIKAIEYAKKLFNEGYFKLHSLDTIEEMQSFVMSKGKAQAVSGSHDDEVATIWIIAYIIHTGAVNNMLVNNIVDDNIARVYSNIMNNVRTKKKNKITGY
jgi:hypothetical protein